MRDEDQALTAMLDPAARARLAGQRIAEHQNAVTELTRVRRVALQELVDAGTRPADIARMLGMSPARVGQLLAAGSTRTERAFFSPPKDGAVIVAVGGKAEPGKKTPGVLISAEISGAYEQLAELARTMDLTTTREVIPPQAILDLNRPGLIVLGSPRILPWLGQLLAADPVYGYATDSAGWYLVNKGTGIEYRSPMESGEPVDYAYVGRLQRPDGKGTFLYLAGIHAPGTAAAARYLEDNITDLYRDHQTKKFSALIECRFDPDTRKILSATLLAPAQRHDAG